MATRRIAVAVVHGVGSQKVSFAKAFAQRLKTRFVQELAGIHEDPSEILQIRGVYWAEVLSEKEKELQRRFESSELRWDEGRNIMIDLGGDALAYQLNRQSSPSSPSGTYEKIHMTFAGTLRALVGDTSSDAPLCIVAHSLGTVIASNYIWDLQHQIVPDPVKEMTIPSTLEQGRTLTLLYTMGSPLAIWSLRFPDFGTPISFPPRDLDQRYRGLPAEWVNLYDADDVIAYPLKVLNASYEENVSEDIAINVGNVLTSWNPASHVGYWTDEQVVTRVAEGLARLWRALSEGPIP